MEIILALASKPKLLLMDEPSAGLTSVESDITWSVIVISSAIRPFCFHP